MTEFNKEELEKLLSDDLLIKLRTLNEIDAMDDAHPLKKSFQVSIEHSLYEQVLDLARALCMILGCFANLDDQDVCGKAADSL